MGMTLLFIAYMAYIVFIVGIAPSYSLPARMRLIFICLLIG